MTITQLHIDKVLKFAQPEGNPVLQIAPLILSSNEIPTLWLEVLSAPVPRIAVIDKLWLPMKDRLPHLIDILRKNLQGVGLLTTNKKPPSLIYFFSDGDLGFSYRGFVPTTVQHPAAKNLPQEFLDFYANVHDGWRDHVSTGMGPYAVSEWCPLSPNLDEPAGKFLVFFNNGGTVLMGYDLEESPPLCYILWGDEDEPPELVPDIWKRLDTWISDYLQDCDPV